MRTVVVAFLFAGGCGFDPTGTGPFGDGAGGDGGASAPDGGGTVGPNGPPDCSDDGSDSLCGYARRIRLGFAIDVADDLVDFPVLVTLDPGRIDYGVMQPAGEDLRFVDADGATILSHEIEGWQPGGTSRVWVRLPRIPASSSAFSFFLLYGRPDVPDGQRAADVWNQGFELVYHMDEEAVFDSTVRQNHAVDFGTSADELIGGARRFDAGESDYVDTTYAKHLATWTVEATVRATAAPQTDHGVTGVVARGANYGILWDGSLVDSGVAGAMRDFFSWRYVAFDEVAPLAAATPYDLVLTYDGDTLLAFRDGAIADTNVAAGGPTANATNSALIGRDYFQSDEESYFDGVIDEVRISSLARPASWVRADHLSRSGELLTYSPLGTDP